MTGNPGIIIRPEQVEAFDRGRGVITIPYVGKWNSEVNGITTGTTTFQPATGIPLHFHNVEESVIVLDGEATATIDDRTFDLDVGQAMWVPAGTAHRMVNRGTGTLTIYWVYGGRDVTRTLVETGETVEHLSDRDRSAAAVPPPRISD